MQMEALRIEALQTETDLEDQYLRHQKELNCLREESLQVGGLLHLWHDDDFLS